MLDRWTGPSHLVFRVTALPFAILLSMPCVWSAGPISPSVNELPADVASAVAAANGAAHMAALIGAIRGYL
jgi:hypothetical protein